MRKPLALITLHIKLTREGKFYEARKVLFLLRGGVYLGLSDVDEAVYFEIIGLPCIFSSTINKWGGQTFYLRSEP